MDDLWYRVVVVTTGMLPPVLLGVALFWK